jgi:putative inorganic carbon (HCO3(-)) transporter
MRDIVLVIFVLIGLGFTLRYPFVGVLLWEWFSLQQPHQEAYGFARSLPLNFLIAVVTVGSWLFSKEPKKIPPHPIIILLMLFLAWVTFNSFFAFDPAWSWRYWDFTWKTIVLGFAIAILANNKIRIDALIWVAAVSLLYYGIKGGIFTIITGGHSRVLGPPNTIIGDNNQLALALLMILPLLEYLKTTTPSRTLALGLLGSEILTGISVLGSYSRGAYIAMAVIASFAFLKVRRKLLYLSLLIVIMVPAVLFMPQTFFDRVGTIQHANTDDSFEGRVMAWKVAFRYATEHFPFGAGFYGPQLTGIFNAYFPGANNHAAHSIYFQVLGEHGFIGLAIYLAIIFLSLRICAQISKKRSGPDGWDQKLARMMQISLVAFYVGGAALSMAYYDLFIVLICILPQLQRQGLRSVVKTRFRAVKPLPSTQMVQSLAHPAEETPR